METNLHLVDFDHLEDLLAANGANVNFACAGDAGTNMSTVIKERILFLAVTDLAEIHFLVGYFPIADSLTMAFTILVTTDVLVPGLALDKCALAMALILDPVTFVRVARWIFHLALAMAVPENKVTRVCSASV